MNGSRFLGLEGYRLLERFATTHPFWALVFILALFGLVLGTLKRLFGRIEGDVIFFAIVVSVIILILGSSGVVLCTMKGFHFGG